MSVVNCSIGGWGRVTRVGLLLWLVGMIGCAVMEGDGPRVGVDPHHEVQASFERWSQPPADPSTRTITVENKDPNDKDKTPSVLTLPDVVQASVFTNLRIQAEGEKILQARAEYWTDSLIPNSQLFTDYQLIPLQGVNINNQAGPPQFDVLVTIPIDWCLFGKRLAAMAASRLGIEVAGADYADKIRLKVNEAVLTFYDLLEAQELAELARADRSDLERIADIVKKQVKAGAAGAVEIDRITLAVLDAQREQRKRDAAVDSIRARLRPLVGRSTSDTALEIRGTLKITKAAPTLSLDDAMALAERNRPDLLSDQLSIQQAQAIIRRERKKAHPQFAVTPGYSYQNQHYQNGFRDGNLFDIGITTSLPITDRNQGNISKAMSLLRESELTLQADIADVRSEVEHAVIDHRNAVTAVMTEDPKTIEAAKSLRDRTEAAYKAGARSLLELLDAQRAYRDRYRATISNQADYWRALQKLHAAIGIRILPEEKEKLLPPVK